MSNSDYLSENDIEQVTLNLDDGTTLVCNVVTTFEAEFDGETNSYVALLPVDADDAEVYLYRLESTDGSDDEELISIEDDEEFEIVSDAFDEIMDEIFFDEAFGDDDEEDTEA